MPKFQGSTPGREKLLFHWYRQIIGGHRLWGEKSFPDKTEGDKGSPISDALHPQLKGILLSLGQNGLLTEGEKKQNKKTYPW